MSENLNIVPNDNVLDATPGQAGLPAEFKHINKWKEKKLTRIPLVTGSELGRAII